MLQIIFSGNTNEVKPVLKKNGLRPLKIQSGDRVKTVMVEIQDCKLNRNIVKDLYDARYPLTAGSVLFFQEV